MVGDHSVMTLARVGLRRRRAGGYGVRVPAGMAEGVGLVASWGWLLLLLLEVGVLMLTNRSASGRRRRGRDELLN